MVQSVADVAGIALAKINQDSSIEDMEKVVGIAKSASDTVKSDQDSKYALSQIRAERLKTWPALIVPLVSLFTLVATVYIQGQQLDATRQQNEDSQWRDFLKSIQSESSKAISDITVAPRLATFIKSKTYSDPASDVARRLLGTLVDQSGFTDLFNLVFVDESKVKLNDINEVSRSMYKTRLEINNKCFAMLNSLRQADPSFKAATCADPSVLQALSKMPPSDNLDKMTQNVRDFMALASETFKISQLQSKLLKNRDLSDGKSVDLQNVYIFSADLSNVDFRKIDVSGTVFDQVNFRDAIFSPLDTRGANLQGCNWWEAKFIDKYSLQYLISTEYPGAPYNNLIVGSHPLTKEYYSERVKELCTGAGLSCSGEMIPYGDDFKFMAAPERQ